MSVVFSALATLCAVRPVPEQAVIDAFSATLPPSVEVRRIRVTIRPRRRALHGARATLIAPPKGGRARARVDYLDAAGQVRDQSWASIRFDLCGPVAVTKAPIQAGQYGLEARVRRESRCTVETDQLGLDLQALQGARSRHSLAEGQVLSTRDVELGLVVARNTEVRLTVRRGALRVHAQARSLDDGHVGDIVRVKRAGRRQWTHARVTGPSEVEVLP